MTDTGRVGSLSAFAKNSFKATPVIAHSHISQPEDFSFLRLSDQQFFDAGWLAAWLANRLIDSIDLLINGI